MSHVDDVVRSDLAALGDDSVRHLPDFDAVVSALLGAGGPYRDESAGAAARRSSLLEDRLRELALLPLAFERVFVHRVSRAAAGAVAVLGVALAVIASIDPWPHRLVYLFVGQPTAPLAAALLVGAVLVAYVAAGLIAERVYERRVRRGTEGDGDPFADLERLGATGPGDQARRLIDRVDAAAVALPLAGVVSGGLLLGLLMFFSDPGYSALGLVAESRAQLVPAVLGALAAGVTLGSACRRDRRAPDGSLLVRTVSHGAALVLGIAMVIATLWFASRTAFGLHAFGIVPGRDTALLLGALGVAALGLPAAWVILRLRAREHRRLA
jgi:hypothetical protein